jgi:hypothetical protein
VTTLTDALVVATIARLATMETTPYVLLADTLDEMRAALPPGMYRSDRTPADQPAWWSSGHEPVVMRSASGMSILQRLDDGEINVWVTSFWDDGFYVRLDDEMNGLRAEGRCDTWVDVERWLDQQARAHYPGQCLCPRRLMFAVDEQTADADPGQRAGSRLRADHCRLEAAAPEAAPCAAAASR